LLFQLALQSMLSFLAIFLFVGHGSRALIFGAI
jgi:hypothetical protein